MKLKYERLPCLDGEGGRGFEALKIIRLHNFRIIFYKFLPKNLKFRVEKRLYGVAIYTDCEYTHMQWWNNDGHMKNCPKQIPEICESMRNGYVPEIYEHISPSKYAIANFDFIFDQFLSRSLFPSRGFKTHLLCKRDCVLPTYLEVFKFNWTRKKCWLMNWFLHKQVFSFPTFINLEDFFNSLYMLFPYCMIA